MPLAARPLAVAARALLLPFPFPFHLDGVHDLLLPLPPSFLAGDLHLDPPLLHRALEAPPQLALHDFAETGHQARKAHDVGQHARRHQQRTRYQQERGIDQRIRRQPPFARLLLEPLQDADPLPPRQRRTQHTGSSNDPQRRRGADPAAQLDQQGELHGGNDDEEEEETTHRTESRGPYASRQRPLRPSDPRMMAGAMPEPELLQRDVAPVSRTTACAFAIAAGLVGSGCGSGLGLGDLPVSVPAENDWHEVGPILEAGPEGAWDHHLAGASTPSSVVQRDGWFWLYYGGADGLRDYDDGPRHRAIGLATSRDGVRFEKVGDAPVVSHRPTGLQEEGANSAAVTLAEDGAFVMHYGAATQFLPDQIRADARVARSLDGRLFEDAGVALSHDDPSVYGFGDELFPLASYRHGGSWFVFYVPNGSPQARDLSVAWGPTALDLEHTALVLDGSAEDPARCGANVVVTDDHVIVFVQRGWKPRVRAEVRIAPAAAPWELGPPLRTWSGPLWSHGTKFFTVTLDRSRQTWFLYRLDWNRRFVLHTAPSGAPDETPPTPPAELAATRTERNIRLSWSDASDPETGIGQYRIRCDGVLVAESIALTWLGETSYAECAVSAVNLHGIEGPASTLSFREEASAN